jgi:hypothetical protein
VVDAAVRLLWSGGTRRVRHMIVGGILAPGNLLELELLLTLLSRDDSDSDGVGSFSLSSPES